MVGSGGGGVEAYLLPGLSMFITCRHATAACQPPFGAPAKSAAGETKKGRRGRNRRQRRGLRTFCLYLPPRKSLYDTALLLLPKPGSEPF